MQCNRLGSPMRRLACIQVRRAQMNTPLTPRAAAAGAGADALVDWVKNGGGSVDGIAVRDWGGADGGSGFGLQASRACGCGATLISLPKQLHLTFGADDDHRLLALISNVPEELWGAKLALQLISHRLQGDASPFAPYIANLPLGFPGLPMFFSPAAIDAIEYPPVSQQVKKRCRWLFTFATETLAKVKGTSGDPFGGAEVDANALAWALGGVTSRAFRVRGPNSPAALLGLIDMCNHSFDPNAKIEGSGGGGVNVVACKDIAAGDPIVISYGKLSNDFLLMDYGFIVPDNPHDTVELRFSRELIEAAKAVANVGSTAAGDAPLTPLPQWQVQALESLGLMGSAADTRVCVTQIASAAGDLNGGDSSCAGAPVDARLLGGVRVLCAATAAEVGDRRGAALGKWGESGQLSGRNEIAMLRTLSGCCAIALSQFSCTSDDDMALLRGGGGGSSDAALAGSSLNSAANAAPAPLAADVQLAVRFRLEKKRLLAAALAALSERLEEVTEMGGGKSGAAGKKKAEKPGGGGNGKGFGR